MIGKTISHFKIIEKIGAGGMGEVYLAEDTELDRKVALKFLPPHYSSDAEIIKRLKREAKAAASLNHPNIITVYEVGEFDGQTFIAMEYVKGESLRERKKQQLSPSESIELISQVCDGLSKAHKADIVHRDIKPENIMIDEDGRVRILDFGLAKLRNVSKLTQTATTLGTLNYMSPEQLQGLEVDVRSDIWSVGVVLYEMITGQLPFKAEYEAAISYSILNTEPEPLARYKTGVPEELQRIVDKALEKDRETRYQHSDELLADLKRQMRTTSDVTSPTPFAKTFKPTRKRALSLAMTAGLLLVILAAGYFYVVKESENQERIPIAVIDFVNESGEPELDGLSGMLITALEQSRRLSVLTRSRMFDILKQMGKADVSQIDEVLGKEICQKANVRTMAIASIKKFGRVYTIDLKLLDTDLNEYLLTVGEKGEGKESIPDLIDSIAEKTRKGMKEAETEIRSTTQKVAAITTPNLEAYQHYFKGKELIDKLRYREAIDEFGQAVALDSTFGLGYLGLAYAIAWDDDDGAEQFVNEYVQKAVRFVDQTPEKERYLIRTFDAALNDGWDAGLKILKQMEKLYPEDKEMTFQIGALYWESDDYQRALQYFEKVLDMDPEHERSLDLMTWIYISQREHLGALDKAFETAKRHELVNPQNAAFNLVRLYRYSNDKKAEEYANQIWSFDSKLLDSNSSVFTFLTGAFELSESYQKMLVFAKRSSEIYRDRYQQLARAYASNGRFQDGLNDFKLARDRYPERSAEIIIGMGDLYTYMEEYEKAKASYQILTLDSESPLTILSNLSYLSKVYLYLGQYRDALRVNEQLLVQGEKFDDPRGVRAQLRKGLLMYWGWGDMEAVKTEAEKAREYSKKVEWRQYWLDYFYLNLFAGEFSLAEQTITDKLWDSLGQSYQFTKAELHSAKMECEKAAVLVDSVYTISWSYGKIPMLYHLAECQYKRGLFDMAEQRLLDLQNIYYNGYDYRAIYYPRSFYLLGKIYERKGDTELAIEHYEKLLNLWTDADEDLPVLIDAKARLAKLQGT